MRIECLITALALATVLLPCTAQCEADKYIERLVADLKAAELHILPGDGTGPALVRDIALLGLQAEEMRLKYARQLQLQTEGIVSANQTQTARSTYERVQIMLAAKKNRVKEALGRLEIERRIANRFVESFAKSLVDTCTNKLPAPSLKPSGAPVETSGYTKGRAPAEVTAGSSAVPM